MEVEGALKVELIGRYRIGAGHVEPVGRRHFLLYPGTVEVTHLASKKGGLLL
jgi:hypothetical protein